VSGLDPDCRDGKHGSCIGCSCACHDPHAVCHRTIAELRAGFNSQLDLQRQQMDVMHEVGVRAARLLTDRDWRTVRRSRVAHALGVPEVTDLEWWQRNGSLL
jgi:hypothetical protein